MAKSALGRGPPKQSSACWLVTGMQQASGPRSGGLWRAVPGRQDFGEAPAGNPPLPLGSLRAEGPGAQLLWRHSRVRAAKSHPETRRAMRKGAQATHPGRGPLRAEPALPRLPGRRRWCTPGTGREKALVDSVGHSGGAQLSWPCLHSHRAVRADEATHILHDPQHPQPHLLAEGQFPLHVPNRHGLDGPTGSSAGVPGCSRRGKGPRVPGTWGVVTTRAPRGL